jgi:hypothetical protein
MAEESAMERLESLNVEPPEVIVGRDELSRRKVHCALHRPSQIYNSLDDVTRDDLDASRSAKVYLLSGAHITGSISVHFIHKS